MGSMKLKLWKARREAPTVERCDWSASGSRDEACPASDIADRLGPSERAVTILLGLKAPMSSG
jgi:hypothetical protein